MLQIESVLAPTLANLRQQDSLELDALVRTAMLILLCVSPACCVGFIASSHLIDLLWSGKWNDSTPVIQCLILSLPFWFLFSTVRASLEANGLWKAWLIVFFAYAIGQVLSPVVGAAIGGIVAIAVCVAIFRAFFCLALFLWRVESIGGVWSVALMQLGKPLAAASGALVIALLLRGLPTSEGASLVDALSRSLIFIAIYSVLCLWVLRSEIRQVSTLLRR